MQPEDRQIIRRFLDRHFPLGRFSFSGAIPRPTLVAQNRLDRVQIQWRPAAVNPRLEDSFHPTAQLEQQIPAVLDLVVGILIPEPALLLLFQIQSEAQATGVDPTLTDLAQSPYRRFLGPAIRDLRQACGVSYMSETGPIFFKADPGLLRLTRHVFMPVEYDLGRKWRMATDLDRHVAPVGVQDMKGIMIHIGHWLLTFEMMLLPTHTHLPNRSLRFPHQTPRVTWVVLRCSSARLCFRSPALQSITRTPLALAQPRIRRLNRPAKRIRFVLFRVSTEPVRFCHQTRN